MCIAKKYCNIINSMNIKRITSYLEYIMQNTRVFKITRFIECQYFGKLSKCIRLDQRSNRIGVWYGLLILLFSTLSQLDVLYGFLMKSTIKTCKIAITYKLLNSQTYLDLQHFTETVRDEMKAPVKPRDEHYWDETATQKHSESCSEA